METSALTFAEPLWFLGLILVPVFAGIYIWSQTRSDALIARIVAPRLKEQLAGAVSRGTRIFKAVLILAAVAFLSVALARPQMGFTEHEVKQRGRDIIIAIDTSRSMLATDVAPTRLARAKLMALDLMRLIKGDRIGLIAFAGSSFLQAPLTLDYSAVLASLDELDTTVIPKGGTNIASAIQAAEDAFGKGEGQTRALVIMTDGEELDADGIAAAKRAGSKGIRIFTVGIGSREGSLIPIRADGGGTDFVRDAAGKPVQSHLDESRLKEIAAASGGFYQPLGPEAAREIFEKGILPMEQSVNGEMTSRQPIERYQWPLGIAVTLIALWMLLGDRRRSPVNGRRAVAAALIFLSVSGVHAATGVEEYESGHFDKAMTDFSQQLKNDPDSVKLQYNAGAAAYKLGDYPKAVDHFTKALLSEDGKLREEASYNLGNSLVRRGEAAKGNDEKKADWKNAIQHYTEALNLDSKNKQAQENRDIVKKLLEDLEKKEKEQQQKQDKQDNQQKNKDQKDQKKDQKDQQQQNKDQQNKDQNKDQQNQDQKDQQKQDQQKSDQQKDQQNNKDQQGKSDQDKKDQQGQQNKDQADNKDQKQNGQQGQDKKDDQNKSGQPDKQDQKDQKDQNGDQNKQDQANQGQQDQKQQQGSPQDKDQQGQPSPTPQPTPGEKKQGDLKSAGGDDEKKDQQDGQGTAAGAAGGEEKDGQMSAAQARSLLNSLRSDEQRVKMMQRQETEDTLKDW
jgi:Ca-activated chloride channel homolog